MRKTICLPSGEKEPANALVPAVNPVRFFIPDPSGRIVTRLADSLGRTKSAFVVRTISFPLGEKFGSVSQPHSPPAKGFLVTRRWAVPLERINQMPLALMSDSYAIHLPSGEKEGCPRSP